jgi:hypothetical protein
LAAKDHVNVFLDDDAIVPDPERIITARHDNKTARTVAIRQGETINGPALTTMFKSSIANNRAGGWRKSTPASASSKTPTASASPTWHWTDAPHSGPRLLPRHRTSHRPPDAPTRDPSRPRTQRPRTTRPPRRHPEKPCSSPPPAADPEPPTCSPR